MKKLMRMLLSIFIFSSLNATIKDEIFDAIFDAIATLTPTQETKADCNFSTQIIQLPFTINTPGFYCLGTNLAAPSNNTGITITTNNVALNLNGKSITGGIPAISFSNRQNIFIGNGTISGINGNALQISGVNSIIMLEDIVILNCTNGASISGITNLFIKNLGIFNTTNVGLAVLSSVNGILTNCFVNNNGTSGGISIQDSRNINFYNCTANANQAQGFSQERSQNIVYKKCTANNNFSHGFALLNTNANPISNRNNIFKCCIAELNGGNGFIIRGNQNTCQSCVAGNNTLNGFSISGINHSILECSALNNIIHGYILNGPGNTILDSLAKFNGSVGFLLAAASPGFPISSTTQMRNNTATGNVTGFQNAGIAPGAPGANRVYSNFANGNGTNFIGIPNFVTSPLPAAAINFTTNIAE